VSGPRYENSNFLKCLQIKQEPSAPVSLSIAVQIHDRKSKAFKNRTANPSNLVPITRQTKIAVGTKSKTIKLALLNIRSLKNKSLPVNDLITTYNLDFMFLNETWLEDSCSAIVLNETSPPNFTFMSVCRAGKRGGGLAALFKDVYQCKQISFGKYPSFEYLGIVYLALFTGLQNTLQPLLRTLQNCYQQLPLNLTVLPLLEILTFT